MKRVFVNNKLCWLMAAWWFATGGVSGAQTQAQTQPHYPETSAETTTAPEALTGDEWEETPQSQTHASFQKGSIRDTRQTRPHQIILWGDILINTLGAIGIDLLELGRPLAFGARYHLPIVHNGFISSLNNWIALEMGLDFLMFLDGHKPALTLICVPIEFMWAFRHTRRFATYWKLGMMLGMGYNGKSTTINPFPLPALQFGFMWDFSKLLHMRMEIGFPGLMRLGLGFGF